MAKKNPLDIVENIISNRQKRLDDKVMEDRQLPLWGDAKRGLPNVLARSALFNSRRNTTEDGDETRTFLKGVQIASLSNYDIQYRGEELRQDDASVFMQLLHLARQQPVGERIHFTAYSMIKALRWGVNGNTYKRLRECLERLAANTVKIQYRDQKAGYGKSLIRAFYWKDDASGEVLSQWCVEFEKEIVLLFGDAAYTLIEWNERHMIGTRATLALWLHSFLATHERPIPLSVEKYFELCESRCQRLYHFRDQLKQALNRLIKIGFVDHFKINEKDMVEITLCPRQVRLANTRMA